ncbi:MAG TPA: biotin/lipoyl-binding protein [Gemmataceae bacterium]|jgi:putative peptide zinc metalloprotease protein|nr:biotin/lipoyl-binding protein [Gemmataceae bacterium]
MEKPPAVTDVERRKQVKIRIRTDLAINPQKYEGKTYYVVKDPVSLRYYRFEEQEHFIINMMNGQNSLDITQKEFEKRFRPKRLTLEDLEGFAQQLLRAGLAHNESPQAGPQLYERRKKRRRSELMQYITNILYIKIPVYDPDKLLNWMLKYLSWIFTTWFFTLSCVVMLGAVLLVATHFEIFWNRLPDSRTFFQFGTMVNLWFALGMVKIIHEFGHGLSCKAFRGEVHEMGALFLCLSPCLYCNVSDAWTLPSKWHRIIISFAGIYVELIIAAMATFYWWFSPPGEFGNNLALNLMVVCSISTFMFNANPLMRFDGYYVLADWLEIPNLRDRSNRFLKQVMQEHCLGMEVQPEPYMTLGRRILFVVYAITSYIYRWVVTFSILFFLYRFLEPYKLGAISTLLALAAGGSMVGWPLFRTGKALHKRGRIPDMKNGRVTVCVGIVLALVLAFLFLPLPVSRIRNTALVQLQPEYLEKVYAPQIPASVAPGAILEHLQIRDGQYVEKGEVLAKFNCRELETQLGDAQSQFKTKEVLGRTLREQAESTNDQQEKSKIITQKAQAETDLDLYRKQIDMYQEILSRMVVRAPRSGVAMSPPKIDEVGKLWEKDQTQPFCSIGDPRHLQVLMPVPPSEYRLLKEDLEHNPNLEVTIRVQGRGGLNFEGRVAKLQEQEAKEVPPQLATKYGGPLAVKPSSQQHTYVPQSQHYLVSIDFLKPDNNIHPGTLAKVKVHCQWRSCAWKVWRWISSTFDLGLI